MPAVLPPLLHLVLHGQIPSRSLVFHKVMDDLSPRELDEDAGLNPGQDKVYRAFPCYMWT